MTTNEIKRDLIEIFRKYYPSLSPSNETLTKIQKALFEDMGNYVHDNYRKKRIKKD